MYFNARWWSLRAEACSTYKWNYCLLRLTVICMSILTNDVNKHTKPQNSCWGSIPFIRNITWGWHPGAETCWAVFKWQVMNLRRCCILLVDSVESIMMHGLANLKKYIYIYWYIKYIKIFYIKYKHLVATTIL